MKPDIWKRDGGSWAGAEYAVILLLQTIYRFMNFSTLYPMDLISQLEIPDITVSTGVRNSSSLVHYTGLNYCNIQLNKYHYAVCSVFDITNATEASHDHSSGIIKS